ncbi:MAG: hypothetical protein ACOX6I_01765 [Syntrophomonadaceae bacterium]|jgi:hypothetical protein
MKNRWGKGEPVNLSDLLKITPVANEILQLSEELNMSSTDVMWIVAQIIDNNQEQEARQFDEEMALEDDWDDIEGEATEDELDRGVYMVNVKISSQGRFPEIGFKAGMNDKEDMNYFFDMIMEMMDKLE